MHERSSNEKKGTLLRGVMGAIGLLISIVFCYLLLKDLDADAFFKAVKGASVPWLLASVGCSFFGFCAMAMRSVLLFSPQRELPFGGVLKSILLAFAANNLFPFRLGDVIRIGYMARISGLSPKNCLSTIGLERVLDLCLVLTFFGILVPVLVPELMTSGLLIGGGVFMLVVIGVLAFAGKYPAFVLEQVEEVVGMVHAGLAQKIVHHGRAFLDGLSGLGSPRHGLGAVFWTLCYWAMAPTISWCWFQAFGLELPWYAPMVFVAYISLGTMLPSTPAFVGTYHFFAAHALGTFGVDDGLAASFAIVAHAVNFLPFTLGTVVLFSGEFFSLVRHRDLDADEGAEELDGDVRDEPPEEPAP